jgi:omega-6 fatty acid desaturase (delta-12 desaturase)
MKVHLQQLLSRLQERTAIKQQHPFWKGAFAGLLSLCIIVFTLGRASGFAFLLILPYLIMFAVGGYIFYAQHNFTTARLRDDRSWDYLDAALNASCYIKMPRLWRWFTANIGYHHIHHVNSKIPFYRLPEAMAAFPEFQNPATTF